MDRLTLYKNYLMLKKGHSKHEKRHYGPLYIIVSYIVKNNNSVRIADLVKEFNFSKGRISQLLNHLEAEDFITKTYKDNSKKQVYVSLSEHGMSEYNKYLPLVENEIDKLVEYMGEEDIKEYNRLITKLLNYDGGII